MQLLIKNLHNESFTIECKQDDTVRAVKETIAARDDLREKYDPDLLKLLCKGKVMDDEDTIESYEIKADNYLVLVKQTPGKPKPPPKKKPNQGINQFGGFNSQFGMGPMSNSLLQSPFGQDPFMQQSFQPNSFMQKPFQAQGFGQNPYPQHNFPAQTQYPSQTEFPVPQPTNNYTNSSSNNFPSASEREEALQTLLGMGFERTLAEKALRASAYTPELAIEFITSGNIPETDEIPDLPPVVPTSERPSELPTIQPFQPSAATNLHQGTRDPGMNLQQIGQMLEQNPQQLQVIKNALKAEHPDMAKMIDENPQGFIDLLRQAGGGNDNAPSFAGSGAGQGQGTIKVELTSQEQQAVNRIQDMGFDRNRVLEAFLACDRNEEMAVNYLLHAYD
ncbi:unnamed protein product [Rotaria sp. Silwood1]|nr:unnamed protein product [Rotaria sp. Silwood1]CAF0762805.1 unnamed protein product [Rotaria sp. Silwood1]CAF3339308.1 unnamed protein product [Rotaria sp. Silwood1]CAF3342840.1 unnamed protein product [Rotaria sp. Silwood1]CAF4492592.1 unnamed protein product [Rotaria sp. Silwood1]